MLKEPVSNKRTPESKPVYQRPPSRMNHEFKTSKNELETVGQCSFPACLQRVDNAWKPHRISYTLQNAYRFACRLTTHTNSKVETQSFQIKIAVWNHLNFEV